MNFSLGMFQTYFRFYSRAFPSGAAQKAVQLMTRPRLRQEKRSAAQDLFERTISLGDGVHLSLRGSGQKKMLLLHGWSGWIGQFEDLIQRVDPAEYTVYALHPEGHGDSAAPQSHPGRFIEAVLAARNYAGAPFDVAVGHSLGAAALVYVEAMQESFRRLVLVAGPATIEGVLDRFADFLKLGSKSRKLFLRGMEKTVGLKVERLDLLALAPGIKTSVLMIHDAEDREIPVAEARSLSEHFRDSLLLETRSLGHSRILQNPEVIDNIIGYISAPAAT